MTHTHFRPGIAPNSTLDFLGTQVDYAPTILALADLPTPSYMDGTNLVPLLVSGDVAELQGVPLPPSVDRSLLRAANAAAKSLHMDVFNAAHAASTSNGSAVAAAATSLSSAAIVAAAKAAAKAAIEQRDTSFHAYYNQGPWMTGCGNLPASNWCKAARHRLDDWSNTWIALVHTDRAGGGAKYKCVCGHCCRIHFVLEGG